MEIIGYILRLYRDNVLYTRGSGYLTSAGFFTHRAASTLGDPVQSMRLSRCHAKAILAIVLFPQRPQGVSS